jgi:hypothetical protein
MARDILPTDQKALQINLDPARYGTFAEIGAGQEVARWFFQAGGAAGTVAKSISAYDMTFSDAIYGQATRYVHESRLDTMLNHEYDLLLQRLGEKRGANTQFFVFADTVAAKSYIRKNDCHGWMGVRFQLRPGGEPHQIVLHVRMWDSENIQQQQALGILGVNLLHGAFYHAHDPATLIASLVDNTTVESVEVDMLRFSGPEFERFDPRAIGLHLVRSNLTNAVMIGPDGGIVQPSEVLYKKPVLALRGRFLPFWRKHVDMLQCARAQFAQEPDLHGEEVFSLSEIPLSVLKSLDDGTFDEADALARLDLLALMGETTLITNFADYFRLSAYFRRFTDKRIGLALGFEEMERLFNERNYDHLAGGILEAFGRLFRSQVKLYVYPARLPNVKALVTVRNFRVADNLRGLYDYLIENHFFEALTGFDESLVAPHSQEILESIQRNEPSWEEWVPDAVAAYIRNRSLFGYRHG